ncbi:MAG: hypothetical protein IJU64_01730 [Bacilli bacterium]|nr:hypothetical protein [Bacilli bacterium]
MIDRFFLVMIVMFCTSCSSFPTSLQPEKEASLIVGLYNGAKGNLMLRDNGEFTLLETERVWAGHYALSEWVGSQTSYNDYGERGGNFRIYTISFTGIDETFPQSFIDYINDDLAKAVFVHYENENNFGSMLIEYSPISRFTPDGELAFHGFTFWK